MNQFDICAILFDGYAMFIPLDKMFYMVYGNPDLWKFFYVTGSFDTVFVV